MGIIINDVFNIKMEYIFCLKIREPESFSFREKGHLLLLVSWCFQVTTSLREVSDDIPRDV